MAADGPLLQGRWRIGAPLGRGSQGQTFVAVEVARRQEVVVKRVKLGAGWKSFELHERETKVLGQLRHAGIPRLHAAFEEPPGTFNLVMQRMPGSDLRALVGAQRLSELELKDILVRALEILDYLATRTPPVVHRDIKPSNLIRDRDGTLALVDFGGVADGASANGSTLVGTYGYMAPEQLHGQATPATDLYALGATIVALAGGVEPEDVPRKGLAMDLAKHLPAMSRPLRDALTAMVAPDPDDRPARPRDVLALLARSREPEPPRALALPTPAALIAPGPRALARPVFTDIPEPLRAALRLALLGVAAGGWVALTVLAVTVRAFGGIIGLVAGSARRPSVRDASADVAGVFTDGRDGFADLAKRAVARRR